MLAPPQGPHITHFSFETYNLCISLNCHVLLKTRLPGMQPLECQQYLMEQTKQQFAEHLRREQFQHQEVEAIFDHFDVDASGVLDAAGLKMAMQRLGIEFAEKEIQQMTYVS